MVVVSKPSMLANWAWLDGVIAMGPSSHKYIGSGRLLKASKSLILVAPAHRTREAEILAGAAVQKA